MIMAVVYLLLLLCFVHMASWLQISPIGVRGLLELAGVIKCSTGRSALAYMMYGCYCGLGGQGWPRDKADWCCHKHDCCYGKAEVAGCQTKTDKYQWSCESKKTNCDALKDKCEKGSANATKKQPDVCEMHHL